MTIVYIDLYQSRARQLLGRAQTWRWRAVNGRNSRRLAHGGEAYTNRQDAINAITMLFGANTTVYLRQPEQGNQLLRNAI